MLRYLMNNHLHTKDVLLLMSFHFSNIPQQQTEHMNHLYMSQIVAGILKMKKLGLVQAPDLLLLDR